MLRNLASSSDARKDKNITACPISACRHNLDSARVAAAGKVPEHPAVPADTLTCSIAMCNRTKKLQLHFKLEKIPRREKGTRSSISVSKPGTMQGAHVDRSYRDQHRRQVRRRLRIARLLQPL